MVIVYIIYIYILCVMIFIFYWSVDYLFPLCCFCPPSLQLTQMVLMAHVQRDVPIVQSNTLFNVQQESYGTVGTSYHKPLRCTRSSLATVQYYVE